MHPSSSPTSPRNAAPADFRPSRTPSSAGDGAVDERGRSAVCSGRAGIRPRILPGLGIGLLLLVGASPLAFGQLPSQLDRPGSETRITKDPWINLRQSMVDSQVRSRGVTEGELLSAMQEVPRHLFVPQDLERLAYEDRPVEIAPGQNLSQAYVSARMISLLDLSPGDRVLEVGTGSGYDAALLSQLAEDVYTIEIDPELGQRAKNNLARLGYDNVHVRIGDGYRGWPEKAPFDAILLTAAPQRVPEPLLDQLAVGGKMVVAVGFSLHQDLQVITKTDTNDREVRRVSLISLAPMTGEVEQRERRPRD
jgi:protein-L-isoaspartate(D-aspartate) O-methyltransferase